MKKITAKVITISSQLLVAILFLLMLFPSKESNNSEILTVNNNNFDKKAEMTSILFEKENSELEEVDDSVISPLGDEEEVKEEVKEKPVEEVVTTNVTSLEQEAIETFTGVLTAYAGDCTGCSGIVASGDVDIRKTMYFEDPEYGTVRILAADREKYPFYSIFRVSNVPGMDPFIGIVLDRGGAITGKHLDLAFTGSESALTFDTSYNVTFELLRSGK